MAKTNHDPSSLVWSVLRIALGYIFLWAFLDKLFGLQVATCSGKSIGCSEAWVHGGSPTAGFLGHATTGPLASFYHHLAGNALIDWAFMLGLLFIGIGLFFGSWIKSASVAGIAMLALMWSSLLWPTNTPGVDEHVIYILILFGLLANNVPQKWTLKIPFVKLP